MQNSEFNTHVYARLEYIRLLQCASVCCDVLQCDDVSSTHTSLHV